jgi:hypothetical protein
MRRINPDLRTSTHKRGRISDCPERLGALEEEFTEFADRLFLGVLDDDRPDTLAAWPAR